MNCVVCNTDLMKRVYRREPEDELWSWSKDLPYYDFSHPADEHEWVEEVWCPNCRLRYMP